MSVYYAFSAIDDAVEKTKGLLWPFNWSIWWRIALISIFTGGVGGFNLPFSPGDVPSTGSQSPGFDKFSGFDVLPEIPDIILMIIAAVFIAVLAYIFLSSVFQFVFVKSLSEKTFRIRQYFMENTGRGLRLFGFFLILLFCIGAVSLYFLYSIFSAINAESFSMIIPAFLIFLLAVIILGVISLFTIDFVVPIMLKDDCGVVQGLKKCWSIIRDNKGQSLIYLVMKVIVSIIVAFLMMIVAFIAILAIGIPFFIVFLIALTGTGFGLVHIALIAAFLVISIPVVIIISVPFTTFIRIYSLSVLGKLDNAYMLIE